LKVLVAIFAFSAVCLAETPQYQKVASVKQIMATAHKPLMDSLAAMSKAGGPKDDKEWELAETQAAMLSEATQLLLLGNRPLDQDVWVKSSEKLQAVTADSAKAAHEKDLEAWKTSVGAIGGNCRNCHTVHRKGSQQ
jgi:cytochrome c556